MSKVVSPYAASPAIYGGYAHGLGKAWLCYKQQLFINLNNKMFYSKGYAPKVSTVVSHGYTAPALGSYKKYIKFQSAKIAAN